MKMIRSGHFEDPFSENLQLSDIYSNTRIDQFFSVLTNSLGQKDFLLLVIGEAQSGKTTLFSRLTNELENNIKPCHLKIRESGNTNGKNSETPAMLYKTGTSRVILLDDAHRLNIHELSVILKNAWESSENKIQVVLFCEPVINSSLTSLLRNMPKKASVNKFYIPTFDENMTKSYLDHYLKIFNLESVFCFSTSDIREIHKKSRGIPGRINHEAGKILSKQRTSTNPDKRSSSLFSPLSVVTVIFFFFSAISGIFLYKKTRGPDRNATSVQVAAPSLNIVMKKIQAPEKNNVTAAVMTKASVNEPVTLDMTQDSQNDQTRTRKLQFSEENIKAPPGRDVPRIVFSPTGQAEEKSSNIRQQNWILSQDPDYYTVQVMAAKEKASIDLFLSLNQNNKNIVAYYRMDSKDGIWYKFISGKFKTYDMAKKACLELPQALIKLGPWPRQFASIQNDIETGSKNKEPGE